MSNNRPMTDLFPDEMEAQIGADLTKLLGFPVEVHVTETDTRVDPDRKAWSLPIEGHSSN